jgi:hypothetical protein
VSSPQRKGPRFFDLPREIRDQIYSEAWGDADHHYSDPEKKWDLRVVLHKYARMGTDWLADSETGSPLMRDVRVAYTDRHWNPQVGIAPR